MRLAVAAWGVVVALSAGCGGETGSGGGGSAAIVPGLPPVEESADVLLVPRAAAASAAVDLATQAATNVILDTFTQGEATGAPHVFLSPPEFEFTSHVEREIDLDSEGRSGNDRFPNVSGLLLITVDGLLQGTWLQGEASYSVLVEAGSDIESVDPQSGVETLIPEGSSWSCMLAVTWEITDGQNWLVVATVTKAIDLEGLVVTDGDIVTTVSVVGGREVTSGIAKIDGDVVRERAVEGSFTITIDDGVNVETVLIEFDADGLILVTIDDEVFGPFTPAEFRQEFGCELI